MNPGICYFYEYNNNKRLRNTGFLKTVKQYQTCLLNINIRGIPVKSDDSIELYAFFAQESDFMSKKVGQISCGDKNICARLTIPESSFPENRALEKLNGFFLKTGSGQYYAALLSNGNFDTSRIVNWQAPQTDNKAAAFAFENPTATETNEAQPNAEKVPVFGYAARSGFKTAWTFEPDSGKDALSGSAADSSAAGSATSADSGPDLVTPAVSADSGPDSDVPASTVSAIASAADSSAPARAADSTAAPPQSAVYGDSASSAGAVTAAYTADPAELAAHTESTGNSPAADSAAYTYASSANTADEDSLGPVNSADTASVTESVPTVTARKIQRCELSILPRRCWNLANNSFLMHGYHNYHHLLLVEDGNHFWVGVPGIYAPREARAAEFFGFPQFTRSYTELMNLEEDEQNPEEDFGYWCRFIS